jgi:ppGpp synthetase/RelA/SpoT-type nucleotidyltranferase
MLDTTLGLEELQVQYEYVSDKFLSDFQLSAFWQEFTSGLTRLDERHVQDHALNLLTVPVPSALQVFAKPFNSVVEKAYRLNYLQNRDFPEPPEGVWIDSTNWYTRLRDIIRTTVVVKYLDGVTAVSELVRTACAAGAAMSDVSMEARDEGYYAMHNVLCVPLSMPSDVGWEVVSVDIPVEIQVATQVQDVIRRLTHTFYEERRSRSLDPEKKWQWNWESPEFVPNYLGHILHYVDGAIMDVRRKQQLRQEGQRN